MQITIITVSQIITMFVFMALGYIFCKTNIIKESASTTLSRLTVNIFLPPMVFLSFSKNFTREVLSDKILIFLFGLAVLLVTLGISMLLAKLFSKNKNTQGIYIYSFTIPNLGYMAYPLVKAIFGELAFLDCLVYCLPYSLFIYSFGMYFLTSTNKISFKTLLTPTMVATIVGIIFGLSGWKMPPLITNIFEMAEGCVTPVAMLLTGVVFARINIKAVFLDWRSYVAAAIRLIFIPLAAILVLKLLNMPSNRMIAAIGVLAMPMGVNSIIFPEAYGGDAESGAKVCFMSAVFSILTIPVIFAILQSVL